MSECVLIALVGAFINMILALIIPCLLNNTKQPILESIKKVYASHKQSIITSSVIVFITIYLAVKITPQLDFSFDNKISLNPIYESPSPTPYLKHDGFNSMGPMDSSKFRIINLSRL